MGEINDTLREFGQGTGAFFDGIGVPLGKFLLIIMIVMMIGAILGSIAYVIRNVIKA